MTSIDLPAPAIAAETPRTSVGRAVVCCAAAAGALGSAVWFARSAGGADIEAPLVLLLRFMAGLKAATALGALGLAAWRTARPIGRTALTGYALGLAGMAAAPAAIWSLAHVALGAGLFHLGLLAFLLAAWGDEDGLPLRRASRRGAGR